MGRRHVKGRLGSMRFGPGISTWTLIHLRCIVYGHSKSSRSSTLYSLRQRKASEAIGALDSFSLTRANAARAANSAKLTLHRVSQTRALLLATVTGGLVRVHHAGPIKHRRVHGRSAERPGRCSAQLTERLGLVPETSRDSFCNPARRFQAPKAVASDADSCELAARATAVESGKSSDDLGPTPDPTDSGTFLVRDRQGRSHPARAGIDKTRSATGGGRERVRCA